MATILKHLKFNINDVVTNCRQLRQWRTRLPLMNVYGHELSITSKDTPSTSRPSKQAYTMSIQDIIQRCLDNPKIYSRMYFGSGIEVEKKTGFWHGELWKKSPLFGKEALYIDKGLLSFSLCYKLYILA